MGIALARQLSPAGTNDVEDGDAKGSDNGRGGAEAGRVASEVVDLGGTDL